MGRSWFKMAERRFNKNFNNRSSGSTGGRSYGSRDSRPSGGSSSPRPYNSRPREGGSSSPRPYNREGSRPFNREDGSRPFNREGNSRDSRPSGSYRDSRPPSSGGFRSRDGGGERRFEGSGERRPYGDRERRPYNDRPRRDFGSRDRGGFNRRDDSEGSVDREGLFSRARDKLREAFTGKGGPLVQSVRTLDDLDSTKSLMFDRIKEWYALNFPEMSVENEETYCRIIAEFGCKEELEYTKLEEIVGSEKATQIMERAQDSVGAPFSVDEKNAVKSLANMILYVYEERARQERFIDAEAKRILPNVAEMADPIVAAKLLSLAGSIEKLGEMPASTIQVIGAEKSLFKHLRSHGRTPSPKHGVIFNNALVHGASLGNRGKVSRTLSAKIAIAARADAFTGNFIAPLLKKQLEKQLKRIGA